MKRYKEPEGPPFTYKGFLYIRCPACGHERGFCTAAGTAKHRCSCGHTIKFDQPLRRLKLCCECGEKFWYHTNITDPLFDIACLHPCV